MHIWEAWQGKRIERMQTDDDGVLHIELEDGRGISILNPDTSYWTRGGKNSDKSH